MCPEEPGGSSSFEFSSTTEVSSESSDDGHPPEDVFGILRRGESESDSDKPLADIRKPRKYFFTEDVPPDDPPPPVDPLYDIGRLDMRVGQVRAIKHHPTHRDYYRVAVDIDENQNRTAVRNNNTVRLADVMYKKQFKDLMVVVVVNLRWRVKGLDTDCWILHGRLKSYSECLRPPDDSLVGQRVFVPGYPFDPFGPDWPWVEPRKEAIKLAKQVHQNLQLNYDRQAEYNGVPLRTVRRGYIKSYDLQEFPIKITSVPKLRAESRHRTD